jgi:hypothetical protein
MRPVNIQYRRFVVENGSSENQLHKAIYDSLLEEIDGKKRFDVPKLRRTSIPDKGEVLLNRFDSAKNWNFGEVALFNPGQGVPVLIDDEDATVLNLREMSLESGRHLIKGVLYYLSCGPHLVYIQPPNVTVSLLQHYLHWLICENGVQLKSPLQLEAKVEVSGESAPKVQSIRIKSKSSFSSEEDDEGNKTMRVESRKEISEAARMQSSDTSAAIDMARAAGMSSADLQLLASLADDGELVADLKLKLVKDGKTVKFDKVKASSLLDHQENDSISLYGENGKYQGDLSRLVYKQARVALEGDFLKPDDCKRALVEAYNFFRSNGHIDGEMLQIE